MERELYEVAAGAILVIHFLWILWVVFGAFLTRGLRFLSGFHILALSYGVVIEVGPWPCPLTTLELHLQTQAGMTPYQQSFLVHYLELLVYPDIPSALLAGCAVAICLTNLCVYILRFRSRNQPSAR